MRSARTLCVALGVVILVMCETAHAQQWPSFRGPNATGLGEGAAPPMTWDVTSGRHVRWRTAIPGIGHSSPVVWGDRVFVTTAVSANRRASFNPHEENGGVTADDQAEQSWRVYCLDARTGAVLWERVSHEGVPRITRHVKASHANATPATDGRHVVAFFGSEGLYSYDMDGRLLWSKDLGVLDAGYVSERELLWGTASSPIIHGGLAIVQADSRHNSFMAAFDVETGREAWRIARDELPSWSTPVVVRKGNRAEIVTNSPNFIRGIDPSTGRELWRFADGSEVKVPTPVVGDGLLYVSGGAPRGRRFYALRPGGSGDVSLPPGAESGERVAFIVPKGGPYIPTPIVYRDELYVVTDNGILSCYDARSGRLIYQQRVPAPGSTYSSSPVAIDGKLFLASEDGDVSVVRAGPDYELLATSSMNEQVMATPAIAGGVLFIRGARHVFAIASDGGAPGR